MIENEKKILSSLDKIINEELGNQSFEFKQQAKNQLEEFLDIVSWIIANEISKK